MTDIDHNLSASGLQAAEDSLAIHGFELSDLALVAAIEAYQLVSGPTVAPFDYGVTKDMVQEVWDTFVKPDQEREAPQSGEMRVLMGILRWAYQALPEN